MFETRLFDRLREEEGATYSPDAVASRRRHLSRLGHLLRRRRDPAGLGRHLLPDRARDRRRPRRAARVSRTSSRARRIRSCRGIERRLATNGYWVDALENWDRDPRAHRECALLSCRLSRADRRRTCAARSPPRSPTRATGRCWSFRPGHSPLPEEPRRDRSLCYHLPDRKTGSHLSGACCRGPATAGAPRDANGNNQ